MSSQPMFAADQGPLQFGRIYPLRREWLNSRPPEPVLEPDLPIIDTHFHFFDLPGLRYMAADWAAECERSGHNIAGCVYVEAQTGYRTTGPASMAPVGEMELVMRETAPYPGMIQGIVGYADLTLGAAVEETLAAQMTAAQGRLRGIRYGLMLDPHPEILTHAPPPEDIFERATFREGLKVLARLGLSFDAWGLFHQQPRIAQLARDNPDLHVVAEHCGGPIGYGPYQGRAQEVFQVWQANMREVAACPNVSLKLGGVLGRLAAYDYLNTERPEPSDALANALSPYLLPLIDMFGPSRCMFESNYPVDATYASSRTLWNAYKRITAHFSPDEKAAMYAGTARRVYRL